jgi:hypothetical protein
MRVVIAAAAKADLLAILHDIARDNPTRALSFTEELLDRCQALADTPKAFPLVPRYERFGIRRCCKGEGTSRLCCSAILVHLGKPGTLIPSPTTLRSLAFCVCASTMKACPSLWNPCQPLSPMSLLPLLPPMGPPCLSWSALAEEMAAACRWGM